MAKSVNFYVFSLFPLASIIITNNSLIFDVGPWSLSVKTWVMNLDYCGWDLGPWNVDLTVGNEQIRI